MPTRRLAAIMFTDIEGYTRLMQESEARAAEVRRRHREVFEHFHPPFNGKILQYYGDGTLSIFDSCVDALQCAIHIQQALQEEPQVPLRIGIHLGDIVQTEKDIYGDGVNVAARVESLGTAGSVLISKDVQKQVKNQDIDTASMGMFEMKNVAQPLEVFAVEAPGLVRPQAKALKGKGKRMKPATPRQWIRLGSVGFAAMVIGAILFWALGSQRADQKDLLDRSVREARVAVGIFENLSDDERLDGLGLIASDWIASSLREINVKTISPEMIRQYRDYIGILPNDPEGRTSFAEITQAQYLINGSYFLQGDSLRLFTRLIDTHTDDEIQQFPVFTAHKSQKEDLIEEARKRLMAYWAMEQNERFPRVRPPKYEAYLKYLSCAGAGIHCHQEVYALDSTFLLNHTNLMFDAAWWNLDSIYYASEAYVRRHWDQCSEYEKNFYTFAKEFWEGNYEKAYPALYKNYLKQPRDILMVQEVAAFASVHLKRPDLAIPIYEQLFTEYDLLRDGIGGYNFATYVNALNRLGRFEETIEFVDQLPEGDWFEKTHEQAWFELFLAYLETGQTEKARTYCDELLAHQNWSVHISKAANIWSMVFQDTIPNPYREMIKNRWEEHPAWNAAVGWQMANALGGQATTMKEYQYYLIKDWEEAERQFLALRGTHWQAEDEFYEEGLRGMVPVWIEAMLGTIYARQGKSGQALAQLEKLEQLGSEIPIKHGPGQKGFVPYWQGKTYAILGDKEASVAKLQQAIDEGRVMGFGFFYMDWDLANLRGFEPFERLLRGH